MSLDPVGTRHNDGSGNEQNSSARDFGDDPWGLGDMRHCLRESRATRHGKV